MSREEEQEGRPRKEEKLQEESENPDPHFVDGAIFNHLQTNGDEENLEFVEEATKDVFELLFPKTIAEVGVQFEISIDHTEREDRSYANSQQGIFAIFDGMGGVSGSAQAAQTTQEVLATASKERKASPQMTESESIHFLRHAIATAAQAIPQEEIATTVSIGHLIEGGAKLIVATLGDSRTYIISSSPNHEKSELEMQKIGVTHDLLHFGIQKVHANLSLDEQKFQEGMIRAQIDSATKDEDIKSHPVKLFWNKRNEISHCLRQATTEGSAEQLAEETDIETYTFQEKDRYMLYASDALFDNLTTEEILWIIAECEKQGLSAQEIANRLTDATVLRAQMTGTLKSHFSSTREREAFIDKFKAHTVRSHDDDVTVIVVKLENQMSE